ncbi:hypothetical protein K502DRAFT_313455 [Neoconidiobolus thromboides FSU 785]|nr:hypothetical protein K502DRAFT_313455 [Neoconidiobolus thromboides FSU 785]
MNTIKKLNLLGLTKGELLGSINQFYPNLKKYQIEQLWHWIYVKGKQDISLMSNLSQNFREILDNNTEINYGEEKKSLTSIDGTIKKVLAFDQKSLIETVMIPENKRKTLCISSQVGCSLACKFCHTGTQKLLRNLTAGEVLGQYFSVAKMMNEFPLNELKKRKINNIVFMGQGEPLYNYRNVFKAVKILTDTSGLNFPKHKIIISTSGVTPMISKIASDLQVGLAISLHAVNDDLRNELVPINKTYNIKELFNACSEYVKLSNNNNKRITFEYVMLKGVNDSISEANQLVRLLSNLPAHVNLIPFNPWPGSKFECSDISTIRNFANILLNKNLKTTIRFSRGDDIMAACGQLKSIISDKQKLHIEL